MTKLHHHTLLGLLNCKMPGPLLLVLSRNLQLSLFKGFPLVPLHYCSQVWWGPSGTISAGNNEVWHSRGCELPSSSRGCNSSCKQTTGKHIMYLHPFTLATLVFISNVFFSLPFSINLSFCWKVKCLQGKSSHSEANRQKICYRLIGKCTISKKSSVQKGRWGPDLVFWGGNWDKVGGEITSTSPFLLLLMFAFFPWNLFPQNNFNHHGKTFKT